MRGYSTDQHTATAKDKELKFDFLKLTDYQSFPYWFYLNVPACSSQSAVPWIKAVCLLRYVSLEAVAQLAGLNFGL